MKIPDFFAFEKKKVILPAALVLLLICVLLLDSYSGQLSIDVHNLSDSVLETVKLGLYNESLGGTDNVTQVLLSDEITKQAELQQLISGETVFPIGAAYSLEYVLDTFGTNFCIEPRLSDFGFVLEIKPACSAMSLDLILPAESMRTVICQKDFMLAATRRAAYPGDILVGGTQEEKLNFVYSPEGQHPFLQIESCKYSIGTLTSYEKMKELIPNKIGSLGAFSVGRAPNIHLLGAGEIILYFFVVVITGYIFSCLVLWLHRKNKFLFGRGKKVDLAILIYLIIIFWVLWASRIIVDIRLIFFLSLILGYGATWLTWKLLENYEQLRIKMFVKRNRHLWKDDKEETERKKKAEAKKAEKERAMKEERFAAEKRMKAEAKNAEKRMKEEKKNAEKERKQEEKERRMEEKRKNEEEKERRAKEVIIREEKRKAEAEEAKKMEVHKEKPSMWQRIWTRKAKEEEIKQEEKKTIIERDLMAEKRIILIRHGQSTSDIENRYGGDYDDHLTPKGRKQAERLADQILKEGIKIEKIFTSPRKRASETADILNRKLKSGVFVVKGMRERNAYGILTGMKKQAAKKRYPKLVEQLSDPLITIRGAENYDHFKNRILGALGRLANTKYKTIILVTHGGPIRCMFRELMKKEFRNMGDCSIIELEKRGRGLKLVRMENAELED